MKMVSFTLPDGREVPKRVFWGKHTGKIKHCCYCELQLTGTEITREHIIPKSKGGRITAPCCRACNQEKRDMLLIDYLIMLYKRLHDMKRAGKIKKTKVKIRNVEKFLLLLYPGQYDFIF